LLSSCDKQSEADIVASIEETDYPETAEVYLLNNLNDTRGFCIDMTGYKTNADVNKALQTHSCYSYQGSVSVDQVLMFLKLVTVSLVFLFLMSAWRWEALSLLQV
jgi:hypothetical protein